MVLFVENIDKIKIITTFPESRDNYDK